MFVFFKPTAHIKYAVKDPNFLQLNAGMWVKELLPVVRKIVGKPRLLAVYNTSRGYAIAHNTELAEQLRLNLPRYEGHYVAISTGAFETLKDLKPLKVSEQLNVIRGLNELGVEVTVYLFGATSADYSATQQSLQCLYAFVQVLISNIHAHKVKSIGSKAYEAKSFLRLAKYSKYEAAASLALVPVPYWIFVKSLWKTCPNVFCFPMICDFSIAYALDKGYYDSIPKINSDSYRLLDIKQTIFDGAGKLFFFSCYKANFSRVQVDLTKKSFDFFEENSACAWPVLAKLDFGDFTQFRADVLRQGAQLQGD